LNGQTNYARGLLNYAFMNIKEAHFDLYDMYGKQIRTFALDPNKYTLLIDESNLSKGLYFYRLILDGNISSGGKIVIVR
jgi:hypothetical protein